jgi:hypothetical protein
LRVELESMAIEVPAVEGHPNRVAFRGVLTLVDAASDKPPAGARGHRVLMTRKAAEDALPSLLGMALDYTPSLDGHDARRKVGLITRAEITPLPSRFRPGTTGLWQLEVGGYIYGRDFPEVVERMRAGEELGMSYEIADARVADPNASIWVLTRVIFTGAAMLLREKAAYRRTWIVLDGASDAGARASAD